MTTTPPATASSSATVCYKIQQTRNNDFLGAFSQSHISKGDLVLCEQPLFTVDAPLQAYLFQRLQSGASGPTPIEGEEDDQDEGEITTLEQFLDRNIHRQLQLKTADQQREFWQLANSHPELPRGYGIFATNAVSTVEETGGLFLTLSRFNSGCRPNLTRPLYDEKRRTFSLFALRDILPGEELTWPYLGVPFEFDSLSTRRDEMKRVFGFDCACDACLEWDSNDALRSESNRRLLKLRRLKEGLGGDKGGRERTMAEMARLAREERLWEVADRLAGQITAEVE